MLLADKGYDSNALREMVVDRKAWAKIPPKSNRKDPICFSKHFYRARNRVERFFNTIKHYRRIATRYDKTTKSFLAALKLPAVRIWPDVIAGGLGVHSFDCTALTASMFAGSDTIATKADSVALTTALGEALTSIAFIASAAAVETVSDGALAGRYLVVHDATVEFSATIDAVIKLSGTAAVANTAFIA